jgi:L-fuconolactonase
MEKIDAHQHFWKFDPARDSWIGPDMAPIARDFLPADLEPVLRSNGIDGSILVQSVQDEEENKFYLEAAGNHPFIRGIVAWTDLRSTAVEDRLAYYRMFPKIKGFRHVLQGEADRAMMLRPEFKNGISRLKDFGFCYDVLIFPDQLDFSAELARVFPDQVFVIDHLAKPNIREGKMEDWKKSMEMFRHLENVACKVSGMVTEADWNSWNLASLKPYLDVVVDIFGPQRLLFGSDWPVCLLACSYHQWVESIQSYFAPFSKGEQEAFWGGNARRIYQIE